MFAAFTLLFLICPLFLVIDTEVAIFAETLGIQCAVSVFALCGFLGPTTLVVAVLAHAVRVILLSGVRAFCDEFSMFLNVLTFLLRAT
jgi:hypothetical protein